MQQTPQQMPIDLAQAAHPRLLAKLVEHARRWPLAAQPGKPSPDGLFGELRHEEVQRMSGGQPRQQMHPPELRRAQLMTAATRESARTKLGNEVVGNVIGKPLKQSVSANRRQ